MVQNIETNNIGQDRYIILLNFNTGLVHMWAHNWCYGAVSNELIVGISHEGIFSNLKNYIIYMYNVMTAKGITGTKGIKQWYIE